jgi:hypothetical protein
MDVAYLVWDLCKIQKFFIWILHVIEHKVTGNTFNFSLKCAV